MHLRKRFGGNAGRVLLSLCLATSAAAAQDPFDGFKERIEQERQRWGAPGLAIAVVHNDKVAFTAGFGVRDLSTGEPVDGNTLFHVGSTTKAFTAAALGILSAEGELDRNDKVVDHLPEFRVADAYVSSELTIMDLLTHRSGVQNTDLIWARGLTSDDLLSRLRHAEPSSSLRSRFEYNNGMYVVAGKLIAAVSRKSFTEFVRQRIFTPLGMNRTTGPLSEISQRKNVATSHEIVDGEMTPIGLTDMYDAGAAGLFYSSVSDYSHWLRVWLNDGKLDDRQIIPQDTVRAAFIPWMVLQQPLYPAARAAGVDLFAYGLGWFLQQYRGRRVNMHTGSIDGMSAIVGLMPEEDVGVVVFINADHLELRHALMYETFDRVIGGERRAWSSELHTLYASLTEQAEERRRARMGRVDPAAEPGLPLRQYAGLYRHAVFGDVEIVYADDALVMKAPPLLKADLKPAGDHRFLSYPVRRGFENAPAGKKYREPSLAQFEIGSDNLPKRLIAFGATFERVPGPQRSQSPH